MRNFKGYKDIVYAIIGSAMEVHSTLHWGLLEAVYNESLCLELADRGIKCESEKLLSCFYKSHKLEKTYKMDVVVDDVVVELKSVKTIMPAHRAQLFNYMRLTKHPIGILINFGASKLQGERYGYIEETNECVLLDRNMDILSESVDWDEDDYNE
ncbi:GxxExxY protein [uncultured Prevotella sp.]|uniref:GxxExxY protein n=1 Tax=uncultured Prevotella sp. TaxID=159272 RepID=UPI0025830602|nr:GxxExxY protein [uncultured Prevotella sp.]